MILWIVLTALTAVLAVVLAVPILRRFDAPVSDRDRLIEVARDQMAEVEAELSRGLIGEQEASEARNEIERRALAAAKLEAEQPKGSSDRTRLVALAIVTGWLVIGATGLYAVVGEPELPSAPRAAAVAAVAPATQAPAGDVAAADAVAAPQAGSVEEMIAKLVARLEETPDDAAGWQMLGWSYFKTERYAQAADAYAKAVELDASDPDVWSAYGETLVRSARGMVTHDALTAFDAALELNPDDPRARFFKGMALEQAGDPEAAIDAWMAIVESAPEGADWVDGVVQRIEELAAASNIDLEGRLDGIAPGGVQGSGLTMPPVASAAGAGSVLPGPTADDVSAAAEMAPEDRQAMIEGMVDRLAARLEAEPDDPQGWSRLVTSRMVLADVEGARAALSGARAAFADQPEKLAIVLEAARAAGVAEE